MSDWLVVEELVPNTDGPLAPLYEAAARGVLALPHCGACGLPLELDQARCDGCGSSAIAWEEVEPVGIVHSVTTVHRREPGLILATEPYHVVDVELAGGHRLLMTTVEATATPPRIGEPANVVFRQVADVAVPALAIAGR